MKKRLIDHQKIQNMVPAATAQINQIAEDLKALGLPEGSVLLVHSSLSSLGQIEGGPESVIQGLLKALGPEGTLLFPTLSYKLVNEQQPVFDVEQTGSNIGAINEYFRKREGTIRSIHPTHSVAGTGKLAGEILSGHEEDNTPCGPHSPFHKLKNYPSFLLMLGCSLYPNTSFHAIEEVIGTPYVIADDQITFTIRLGDSEYQKPYFVHGFDGWAHCYERLEEIWGAPDLKRGNVLQADCWLMPIPAMWEVAMNKLREDIMFFVREEPNHA